MVINWLNFEVKRKLCPRKKIFVDLRQERLIIQLTNLSLILLEVIKYSASWSFGTKLMKQEVV
jgi:hypothetical protein